MVEAVVRSKNGLHARPAGMVVEQAVRHGGEVVLIKEGIRCNAKSILNIMGLGLAQGDRIAIAAEGEGGLRTENLLKSIIEGIEE
ncbi:HPr family phosphocarrier protein [Anaerotalea alkaliphila]|uniref:HPr family phosphocarrier protein n=1 Tax=Anaerotalea alkaliphila TaxID=2662126 RepID=A0A7X5KNX3_9FIRM|nr:HPr family phosphocarrier protein [Anaerotalea alkaliphila]NDL68268.1 HPr family phosphocarrier protein [Anaerotalea alkaliphila]